MKGGAEEEGEEEEEGGVDGEEGHLKWQQAPHAPLQTVNNLE